MCIQVCQAPRLTMPVVCRRKEDVQTVDAADRKDLLAHPTCKSAWHAYLLTHTCFIILRRREEDVQTVDAAD
jgi:hypothetical protein